MTRVFIAFAIGYLLAGVGFAIATSGRSIDAEHADLTASVIVFGGPALACFASALLLRGRTPLSRWRLQAAWLIPAVLGSMLIVADLGWFGAPLLFPALALAWRATAPRAH